MCDTQYIYIMDINGCLSILELNETQVFYFMNLFHFKIPENYKS